MDHIAMPTNQHKHVYEFLCSICSVVEANGDIWEERREWHVRIKSFTVH